LKSPYVAVSSTSNPSVQPLVYVTPLDRHCDVTLSLNSDAINFKNS